MIRAILLLLLACLSGCVSSPRPDDPRPNVVIVFFDDMGYGDLGCYGQTGWRTPHIDRLATTGNRLTDFYVAQAVCSASRAAILTGCYPNRLHIGGAFGPHSKIGLNPDETTLAEVCKARGYATAVFGKWHLGDAPNLLPTRQGFDLWYGIPYSNDMWPLHPDLVKLPPDSEARKRGYPALPMYENERIVDAEITPEEQARFTRDFTDRACGFIAEHAAEPFLVYLAHPMPHVPLFPSPEFEGRSRNARGEWGGRYGDVIEELDWSVGRIVDELEKRGLREKTLLIVTSDNGPWLSYGDHAGTTAGLREGKGTSWEGGERVPFIASWPGRIPAGQVSSTPAMTIDLLPTIEGFVNTASSNRAPHVGAPAVDGVDISSLLTTGDMPRLHERPLAFYYNANDLESIRRGKWKLVLPHQYRTLDGEPGSGGMPGPYRHLRSGLELYDLQADPRETRDVAAEHPDVVKELERVAETFRTDLGDSLTKREGANRRPAGRSEEPAR